MAASMLVGLPRSPSALLALGSPHPYWAALREGMVCSAPTTSKDFNYTIGCADESWEESKEEEAYGLMLDDEIPSSSMKRVVSYSLEIIVSPGEALPEEDEDISEDVPSLKKVSSSIQIKKVPSLSAIHTQVGDLAQDFANVLQNQDEEIQVNMLIHAFRQMESAMRKAGMSLSANDLANNIAKVESAHQRAPQCTLVSDLLRQELEVGVHKRDRKGNWRLADKSAAMGLLWLGRNLRYQFEMYQLLLQDDHQDPVHAARTAFQRVLEPHLNWAISKVVQAGISSLTPSQQCVFFCSVGGFDTETFTSKQCLASKRDVQRLVDQWEPLLDAWENDFAHLELERI